MVKCYECGYEFDEDERQYDCPFCGEMDYGEGFYQCENCDTLMDYNGDMWECEHCENEGIEIVSSHPQFGTCPNCGGMIADDGYCEDCGENEDVNQGWIGENY